MALAVPTAAQQPLRLVDVYRELAVSNPRIAAAEALAAAGLTRVQSAGRPSDPELQLGWMNYSLPGLTPMPQVGMTQLQLMQLIPLGGKLRSSRRIAEHRAAAGTERVGEVAWEVRAEAAMAFYGIHEADRSLAVMRESIRILEDVRRTAESMYRVGAGRQSDVLRAQVEIARMTEDTLRMTAMRDGMAARLNALLDREPAAALGETILPGYPSEVPQLDSLIGTAYANRPMIRAGHAELAAADEMRRLAQKELFPDLTVGIQYGQRKSTMTAEPGMRAASATERMGSLMLGVSIPLWARSRQLPARDEAEAMRAMATSELASMRADVRGRIATALAELTRARRLTHLYLTTILPQAEATAQSALSAYRVGQVDFMTLLESRMNAVQYRRELAVLEADEGRAWAELEMLTGSELFDPSGTVTLTTGGAR